MSEEIDKRRFIPLDRKEIRGFTIQNLIQYASIFSVILLSIWSNKVDTNKLTDRLILLEERVVLLEKKIELHNTYYMIDQIWKARFEEKNNFKNNNNDITK